MTITTKQAEVHQKRVDYLEPYGWVYDPKSGLWQDPLTRGWITGVEAIARQWDRVPRERRQESEAKE